MGKKFLKAVRTKRPVRVRLLHPPQRQEWVRVGKRLAKLPVHFHPQQAVELVARCCRSPTLRRLLPYVSLGRLGLGLPGSTRTHGALCKDDSPCLFFHQGQYTVSSYDNVTQNHFNTAAEAVAFAEQYPTAVPRNYSARNPSER